MQIVLSVTGGPHAGREFSFDGHDNFIVGRSKSAQFRLSLKDQYFSRNHFLVEVNPPLCRLLDLNSTNGTYVNGKQVTSVELHDGDTIEAGDTTLSVRLVATTFPASGAASVAAGLSRPAPPPAVNETMALPRLTRSASDADQGSAQVASARAAADRSGGSSQEALPTLVPPSRSLSSHPSPLHPPRGGVGEGARGSEGLSPSHPSPLHPPPSHAPSASPTVWPAKGSTHMAPTEDYATLAPAHQLFEGYEILEELGRGGMGVVYRARSQADGACVALKVVLPAMASSSDDLARFVREAGIVKNLDHPHIVRFRDLGHADGKLFFVMDLVPGMDGLATLRQHQGPFPVRWAVGIVCQLSAALAAAHRAGYVHRDVKPANLLIEQRGTRDHVWLADFGLARVYQASKISGLTTTGNIGGTLPYMAPEQITNYRDVTPAADQYSAAATLYYLLTRAYPYDFPPEVARQLLMVLQDPPLPIQSRRPDLPDELAAVIHKGLARLPADRFADVGAFRTALKACFRRT